MYETALKGVLSIVVKKVVSLSYLRKCNFDVVLQRLSITFLLLKYVMKCTIVVPAHLGL